MLLKSAKTISLFWVVGKRREETVPLNVKYVHTYMTAGGGSINLHIERFISLNRNMYI
jgi:hypothetical protein